MNEYVVTENQISDMQHCIGLDYKKPKRGVYRAYRNYYDAGKLNESWNQLVKQGLANVHVCENSHYIPPQSYLYSLSAAGLEFVGKMIGAKVVGIE